jgi:hypothetical protein
MADIVSHAANLTRILYIDDSIANEISVVLCYKLFSFTNSPGTKKKEKGKTSVLWLATKRTKKAMMMRRKEGHQFAESCSLN